MTPEVLLYLAVVLAVTGLAFTSSAAIGLVMARFGLDVSDDDLVIEPTNQGAARDVGVAARAGSRPPPAGTGPPRGP